MNLNETIKRTIIVVFISLAIVGLIGFTTGNLPLKKENAVAPTEISAEADGLYALTTVVVSVDYYTNTVKCVDFNGTPWTFNGTEDWMIGDFCSMIVDNMGTELIADDIIVGTPKYDGWLNGSWGYDANGNAVVTIID